MNKNEIKLLQFFICRDFTGPRQDSYQGESILGNLNVSSFPYKFESLYAVTCWRKDKKFHKEVIEYETDEGQKIKSPHMDIEPVTNSVLFRWHKHRFPQQFPIPKPTHLTVRVLLDGKTVWESYILIEQRAS